MSSSWFLKLLGATTGMVDEGEMDHITDSPQVDILILIVTIIAMGYLFCAVAVLCDNFFMPCLLCLQKKLRLSDSIAGATFLAIPAAMPELCTNAIAVARGGTAMYELGLGTMVGSGAYDLCICLGIASLFAVPFVKVRGAGVYRDFLTYLLAVVLLGVFIRDRTVHLYEATCLFMVYVLYVVCLYVLEPRVEGEIDMSEPMIHEKEDPDAVHTCAQKTVYVILKPLHVLFEFIVPRKGLKMAGEWYHHACTFACMLVYIVVITRAMILLIDVVIAPVLEIPHSLAGLTIVAWGANVPNAVNASIAVKLHSGDMAISGAVGSQIINISVGLGLPWMFSNLFKTPIVFLTDGLLVSVYMLGGIIMLFLLLCIVCGMKLSRVITFVMMPIYIGFFSFEWFVKEH